MPRFLPLSAAALAVAVAPGAVLARTGTPTRSNPAPEAVGLSRRFGPRDVFALAQAEDAQISPDGRRIA